MSVAGESALGATAPTPERPPLATRLDVDESESLLTHLVERAAEAVLFVDARGHLAFANEQAHALFGYEPGTLAGRPIELLVPDPLRADHVIWREAHQAFGRSGVMGKLRVVEGLRADGTRVPVEISLTRGEGRFGPFTAAMVRDVTARVEAEARLVRSERMYSMLADANAAILRARTREEVFQRLCDVTTAQGDFALAWVGTPVGDRLEVVAFAGPARGYLEHAVIRHDGHGPASTALTEQRVVVVDDLEHAALSEPWRDRALRAGIRSVCALPVRVADEVHAAFAIYGPEVGEFDERRVALLAELASDVSVALQSIADREAEAAARAAAQRSEAQLQAVLSLGRDIVSLVDGEGRTQWTSGSVETILGFPPEHYLDRDVAGELHPDDVERSAELWFEVVERPGASTRGELRMRHRDGTFRWVEITITNRTDELGPVGFVVNMHDITDQRRARDGLRFQADLLAAVGEAVVALDAHERVVYWNDAATKLYGFTRDEVMGRPVTEFVRNVDPDGHRRDVVGAMSAGRTWSGEVLVEVADGRRTPLTASCSTLVDDDGRFVAFISVASGIAEVVQARQRLEARAAMQAEIAALGQLALAQAPLEIVLAEVLAAADRVLGFSASSFVELRAEGGGRVLAASGRAASRQGDEVSDGHRRFLARLLPALGEPVVIDDLRTDARFNTAGSRAVDVRGVAAVMVERRGEPYGVLGGFTTEPRPFAQDEVDFLRSLANIVAQTVQRQDDQRELVDMALHDALTGLPNRTLLLDRIDHASERSARSGSTLAVLLVDLDGFKVVNDALGHQVGDDLLIAAAERLQDAVRTGDTVARLGGDEFAILCEDVSGAAEADVIAGRIGERLADPFLLGRSEAFVTASIGITVRTGTRTSADVLLREADAAMYRAKDSGRARHALFDDRMRELAVHRLELSSAMRRAVERHELRLLWQPEVPLAADAEGRTTAGAGTWAEALVRWEHPELGLLGPGEFIDLAEETGYITELGEWVFREACRTVRAWDASDGPAPDVVSVNVSARQLAQPDLVESFAAVLRETGVAPERLMLEITETAVMIDQQISMERLAALKDLGLGLAIDDFGTGYSSLTYLRKLPVDVLKVDRSFVSGLEESLEDRAIVEGIIGLAHAVGLQVVAEGVESDAQRDELCELGCDWAQGYLWSKPVTADELQAWIVARRG